MASNDIHIHGLDCAGGFFISAVGDAATHMDRAF